MQLSLSRFFSDRVVFDGSLPLKLRITNSFWDWCKRMISWIYSPASYTETNRKTVQCFKKYLVDTLGAERLQKISSRYSVDFDRMEKRGSPLLSRHVAQMVIGSRNMGVEDISNFRNLNALELDQAIQKAQDPFRGIWKVEDIKERISGKATEWLGRVFYDPFLADRERLQLCREHPAIEGFEDFLNHMVAKVIKREMDVGTLVPAQNQTNGTKQYYVVRGKVVTGEGMVSYILDPATQDTNLPSIRLFRGTGPRNGEIDGISSLITDFESDLGRSAYESGIPYERYIENKPTIEAGHSLGGNLVQWRAAHMTHVKELYSFSSPGIRFQHTGFGAITYLIIRTRYVI